MFFWKKKIHNILGCVSSIFLFLQNKINQRVPIHDCHNKVFQSTCLYKILFQSLKAMLLKQMIGVQTPLIQYDITSSKLF